MSKLLGFGLIVSGMVVGGVALPLSASAPSDQNAPAVAAPATVSAGSVAETQNRSFSVPALKPLPPVVTTVPSPLQVVPPPQPVRAPAAPAPRKPLVPQFETVTLPEDPAAITRALQVELARVGCYAGPATGFWGPDTRRAMKAFTDRVNATLPIQKPDVILLSLVRAEPSRVCGKACPAGQDSAADGRCVPKAVLAQAQRKAHPALAKAPHIKTDAKPDTVIAAAPPAPVPVPVAVPVTASPAAGAVFADTSRMGLAGPKPVETPPPGAAVPAAASPTSEKPAPVKQAKKRERPEAPAQGNARYGQTKWAREFFKSSNVF